jgi:hypothetical protein
MGNTAKMPKNEIERTLISSSFLKKIISRKKTINIDCTAVMNARRDSYLNFSDGENPF